MSHFGLTAKLEGQSVGPDGRLASGSCSRYAEFALVLLAVGGAFAFAVVIMASKDWLAVAGPLDLVPRALVVWALLWVYGFGGPTNNNRDSEEAEPATSCTALG